MLQRMVQRSLHVGQQFPALKIAMVTKGQNEYAIDKEVDSAAYFKNKKVVVVSFPGAFTPTCTGNHIPGYIAKYNDFKAKGVEVVGLAVNDAFVLKKFGDELKGSIPFICDGSGILTKALDAGLDLTDKGLGIRSRRFSMLVDNGVIKVLNDEHGGAMTDISKAETILKQVS